MLKEEAYPVKLDKANDLLVGRGLLECDPLLLKDHVGVTNVCHFRVTPRYKGVMSTCRWQGDALLTGRSRRGNGNDSYCDAGPQAILNCAEVKLT